MDASESKQFLQDCENDSKYFGDRILKSECWDKQLEIKQALRDFDKVAVKSSHGVGKTYVAADIVIEFLYTHYNSIVITTATTAKQVKNLLWAEINGRYSQCKQDLDIIYPISECLQVELRLGDQWKALGLSPRKDTGQDVATSIQGFHAQDVLILIDEAGGVAKAIYDSVYGMLTSKNCKFLIIGNPTHVGTEFYRICKNKPKGWKVISMNTLDLPNIKIYGDFKPTKEDCYKLAEEYEKDKDRDLPFPRLTTAKWFVDRLYDWGYDNPLFQSRALGIFPEKSEDSVFSLSDIENSHYIIKEELKENTARSLGIDVARFGDDKTVFTVYQDGIAIYCFECNGKDIVEVCNLAEKIYREFQCEVIGVDDTGVGGGVTDTLKHKGYDVMAFNAGEKASREDEFENKKAEIYFMLAQAFKDKEIFLPEEIEGDKEIIEKLKADLMNIKYEITSKGRLRITPKDKMKKLGVNSPDHAESFMIAFWAYHMKKLQTTMFKNNLLDEFVNIDIGLVTDFKEGY